jgi:rubrerythrin
VALDAEKTAQRYYLQLRDKTQDRALRSIYAELASFEADHTSLLERKLEEARRAVRGGEAA